MHSAHRRAASSKKREKKKKKRKTRFGGLGRKLRKSFPDDLSF